MTPTFSANLPIGFPEPQDDSPGRLVSLPNNDWERYHALAMKAVEEGDGSTAEAMWLAALEQAERKGVDKVTIAHMFDELAGLYFARADYALAEIFCRRALYTFSSVYEGRHSRVANCLNNLAGICYNLGRLTDAETLCTAALEMFEQSLGTKHPEVGLALHNLAMIHHAQMKFVHAERNYRRALAIRSKALGHDDKTVIRLMDNYASLLEMTDRSQEAQDLRQSMGVDGK